MANGQGMAIWFFPGGMPNKKYLDSLVPDKPVYIRAYDGHTGLANSKALEMAGINKSTVYKGFGEVVKDANGEPTGALLEGAQELVGNVVPKASREDKLNSIRQGLKYAASSASPACKMPMAMWKNMNSTKPSWPIKR